MLLEHVRYGIERGAHAIACDAGSTDSGPFYLACGVPKYARESVKRDLHVMMQVGSEAGIPILIGSCATAGTDAGVDWMCDIVVEIAHELGIAPKIALLYSEQSADVMRQRNDQGKIRPLPPSGKLSNDEISSCEHIVALMGPEPYIQAIEQGAEIVLGGRTTDTAVLAAVPLMRGASVPASWHAAKVAECGGVCTVNPRTGGVLFIVEDEGFEIEPLNLSNRCSPESVSAHMLYETSDPLFLRSEERRVGKEC